jgi:hypothetical protein
MIPAPLVEALLTTLVFLEMSDESIVDPDSAADLIQGSLNAVLELPEDERAEFLRIARTLADGTPHPDNRACMFHLIESIEEAASDEDDEDDD